MKAWCKYCEVEIVPVQGRIFHAVEGGPFPQYCAHPVRASDGGGQLHEPQIPNVGFVGEGIPSWP